MQGAQKYKTHSFDLKVNRFVDLMYFFKQRNKGFEVFKRGSSSSSRNHLIFVTFLCI